jgi:hypothetical protein
MNDEPNSQMIEALRERQRQIELEISQLQARAEEVADMLVMLQGPRRGRPRRQPPPPTGSEAEAARALDELLDGPPAPDATP